MTGARAMCATGIDGEYAIVTHATAGRALSADSLPAVSACSARPAQRRCTCCLVSVCSSCTFGLPRGSTCCGCGVTTGGIARGVGCARCGCCTGARRSTMGGGAWRTGSRCAGERNTGSLRTGSRCAGERNTGSLRTGARCTGILRTGSRVCGWTRGDGARGSTRGWMGWTGACRKVGSLRVSVRGGVTSRRCGTDAGVPRGSTRGATSGCGWLLRGVGLARVGVCARSCGRLGGSGIPRGVSRAAGTLAGVRFWIVAGVPRGSERCNTSTRGWVTSLSRRKVLRCALVSGAPPCAAIALTR